MKILSVVSVFFLSQINPLTKNEKNVILTPIFHGFQDINLLLLDQFEITFLKISLGEQEYEILMVFSIVLLDWA